VSSPPGDPTPRPGAGFTERVRQELARLPLTDLHEQRAELAALLRLGGVLHLHAPEPPEGRLSIEVVTTSGAVARRVFGLLQSLYHLRAELRVRAPGGVQRQRSYAVVVATEAERIGRDTGLLDRAGRPDPDLPAAIVAPADAAAAYLRGALLATGSISGPRRAPHLEIVTASDRLAEQLAALGRRVLDRTVTAVLGERPRVVLKSGEAIGELLAAVGASGAFLAWDEQRLRRSLRNQANRLANADAANLRRTIDAAAAQTAAVEAVIEQVGWDGLDPELRDIALARLANPAASLAELGELCDPPVGKSSVHRRLRRLLALTDGDGGPD
jgi:DNA-binding protein WhiA